MGFAVHLCFDSSGNFQVIVGFYESKQSACFVNVISKSSPPAVVRDLILFEVLRGYCFIEMFNIIKD